MSNSVIPWSVAHQASLSMEFSRQEYWSGQPFPSLGIFPAQGSNPGILHSLLSEPPGKPNIFFNCMQKAEYNLTLELPETWEYILGLGMIFYFVTHEDSDTFFSTSFHLPHSPLLWPIFKPLQSPSRSVPGGSVVKNPPANAGDTSSIPGLGRSPGEGNGNQLQYSCLGNFGQKSLAGYSPWGLKRVRHDLATTRQQQPSTSQEFLKDLTE